MRCAEGHQGAPAALLSQMRGNSHLLALKEVRQQRQVSMQSYFRALYALNVQ
jgi:hypothetical protein